MRPYLCLRFLDWAGHTLLASGRGGDLHLQCCHRCKLTSGQHINRLISISADRTNALRGVMFMKSGPYLLVWNMTELYAIDLNAVFGSYTEPTCSHAGHYQILKTSAALLDVICSLDESRIFASTSGSTVCSVRMPGLSSDDTRENHLIDAQTSPIVCHYTASSLLCLPSTSDDSVASELICAFGNSFGDLVLWNVSKHRIVAHIPSDAGVLFSMQLVKRADYDKNCSPTDLVLLTVSDDRSVRIWNCDVASRFFTGFVMRCACLQSLNASVDSAVDECCRRVFGYTSAVNGGHGLIVN